MKLLFDLFPVILFFGVFKWGKANPEAAHGAAAEYLSGMMAGAAATAEQAPILLATAVAIVATFLQIGWLLVRRKKIDPMLWVSLVIITVFGGATIYFNNPTFIKWKPTVLYWFFGAALLAGQYLFGKNLLRLIMGKQIALPDPVWERLSLIWVAFFAAMGVINLFVAYSFSLETWVDFKLFGFTGLMFAFIIAQSFYLSKYIKES